MAKSRQVLVIDLLRVLAATGVVLHHLVANPPVMTGGAFYWFLPDARLPAGGAWAAPGWVGVEIFFVISGYVIAHSASGVAAPAFLARRALRLVPAAWICGTLTALVLLGWSDVPRSDVLTLWSWAVLFLPRGVTIDPSWWTLELELVFYLIVALALGGGVRRAERATLALGVASAAFLLAATAAGVDPDALNALSVRLTLLPHGVFFALGALLAASAVRGVSARGIALSILLGAGALAEVHGHGRTLARYFGDAPPAWLPAALFAAAVAAIMGAERLQRPLERWVGERRLLRLSAATYPLYLLHQVIGSALLAAGVAAGLPVWLATLLAIAGVVALALLVAEQAEPALRRWLRRVFSGSHALGPNTLRTASPPAG